MATNILLPSLAITVIILGLYIVIVSFRNSDHAAEYHIGCYLSPISHDYSLTQRGILKEIAAQNQKNLDFIEYVSGSTAYRNSRNVDGLDESSTSEKIAFTIRGLTKKDWNSHSNAIIDQDLRKKSVKFSKLIESYIQKLVLKKRYQENNMQFFTQLKNAKSEFELCRLAIISHNVNHNPKDCKTLWAQYQSKCSRGYDDQKNKLKGLFDLRNGLMGQLVGLLVNTGPDDADARFGELDTEAKRIKLKYDRLNDENDRNKEKTIAEFRRVQYQNNSKMIQIENSFIELNNSRWSYMLCKKNLKQFRKCEQTRQKIDQIGRSQTFDAYESRLKKKRQRLTQLNKHIVHGQLNEDHRTNQLKERMQRDIQSLIKLLVDTDMEQDSQCGCSDQQKTKLEKQYMNQQDRTRQLRQQGQALSLKLKELQRRIHGFDHERESLLKKYQEQISALMRRLQPDGSLIDKANSLELKITDLNSQILTYQRGMYSLQFQCNQLKDRLSRMLLQIDKVVDCQRKRALFMGLYGKTEQILQRDGSDMIKERRMIGQALSDIEYPQGIGKVDDEQALLIKEMMKGLSTGGRDLRTGGQRSRVKPTPQQQQTDDQENDAESNAGSRRPRRLNEFVENASIFVEQVKDNIWGNSDL